jgi:trimethylamine--corrinoid protein Co-methyltransferase
MIYGLGMLESGITFDFGQLVLDAEIARMIKHVVKGIPVDDETLAVDVIREVGPFGDFLCHNHTLQRMRSQSQPEFIDRTMRETWEKKGSKDIHEKAMEKVKHILETHKPEPLPRDVLDKIRAIVLEATPK